VTILVAGHYCHDTVFGNASVHRALGGTAAYAPAILDAFGAQYDVVAKVGTDFLYASAVSRQPTVVPGPTTAFVGDYRGGERTERVEAVTPPIEPADLVGNWDIGLAGAVAGELPLRTLRRLREISRLVLADAQSIVREISPRGEVVLRPPAAGAVEAIDVLKASRKEAGVLDVTALRRKLILIVTDGPRGCTIFRGKSELHVDAFPALEKDPTGAGDCFLAGLAIGLSRGLPLEAAARIGAWCGARAVEHVGVPRLTAEEARAASEAA
jgi:1D-myo-inositol 3-kinase